MKKIEEVDRNLKAQDVNPNALVFLDPIVEQRFDVEGLAFFNKDHTYNRMPEDAGDKITKDVAWLARHTSGGQIRFRTNSKKIAVRIKNQPMFTMVHMPQTGQRGADLYYRLMGKKKYSFFKCAIFNGESQEYEAVLFESDEKAEKDIIINLPLYLGIESLQIGIESDATLAKAKKHKEPGKVVFYGTSVTQGGCCSRPGMSYTNIMSRDLDMEFINLGFSGNGLGTPQEAEIITTIDDVRMVVLDYEANGGSTGNGPGESHMERYMDEFISILRAKWPDMPILVITKVPFTIDILTKQYKERRARLGKFQQDLVNRRIAEGDRNLYFLDGKKAFGNVDPGNCLIDGIHLNDLGFYQFAKYVYPVIRKILHK